MDQEYEILDVGAAPDRENYPDESKYTLSYKFSINNTNKTGRFNSEFVVDFLGEDGCGKIKFPIGNNISIIISDSITKTTVI